MSAPTWHDLAHKWEDMAIRFYRLMFASLILFGVVTVMVSFDWLSLWVFFGSAVLVVVSAGGAFYSMFMHDKCQSYDAVHDVETLRADVRALEIELDRLIEGNQID
jgi:hypothetical protein